MLKLLKWAYKLGVDSERQRIKKLIAEYQNNTAMYYGRLELEPNKKELKDEVDKRFAVQEVLKKLVEPKFVDTVVNGDLEESIGR